MNRWNYRVSENTMKKMILIHIMFMRFIMMQRIISKVGLKRRQPMGDSLAELRCDIHYFLKAFQKPVLTEKIKRKETLC